MDATEPERTTPREYTVYEPNTPLPAVLFSYPAPAGLSPDLPALIVMDAILSNGESSRLYESLVHDQQIAADVMTNFEPSRDPGAYVLAAILSEGKSPDDGVRALQAEIARMRDTPVTDAELEEARNELVFATLKQRETAFGRAFELADSVLRFRDPAYSDRVLGAIQQVTAADVQRVAAKLLVEHRRVTIRYLSDESRPKPGAGDTITTAPTLRMQRLDIPPGEIPVVAQAPEGSRVMPPAPGPVVNAALPGTVERTLANGLRVIVSAKRELPLLSATLTVRSGSAAEAAGRGGSAALTADVVTKGTATRSATDIAQQIESLGATLTAGAGKDTSAVAPETRSDNADAAFPIMADVARNPAFAANEVEHQRQLTLDSLSVTLRQPAGIARMAQARLLFGTAPYGNMATPASVAALTREQLAEFHAANWRPDNAVLVLAGDVTPEQGFALAEKYYGDWARPAAAMAAAADARQHATARRDVLVDLPKSGQAAVTLGLFGPARAEPGYFPTLVANAILGGGYSSRLNLEIRVRRGLSYGAFSALSETLAPGSIVAGAQTRNDAVVEVVGLMEAELRRLAAETPGAEEVTARKAGIVGAFGRAVETTAGLAGELGDIAAFRLPLEKLGTYVSDVDAVTAVDVQAAAARFYDAGKATLVVVGDGAVFAEALKQKRPALERIGVDALNLDSPDLK